MEDLASEFREDFLDAVKVLEDFSSSDGALREALKKVRGRVDMKQYSCAPNFWEDLRVSLGCIERKRDEGASKSKAQQVMKQIARLEVKFWAKESMSMLQDLDPEDRLERIVLWMETFECTESSDLSSGPAVLYQVLNDISLQKDMDSAQREALTGAIKDSLHKFPVEMQAVLERVGILQGGGIVRSTVNDWRRRAQPTSQEATSGGTRLTFLPVPKQSPAPGQGEAGSAGVDADTTADQDGASAGTGQNGSGASAPQVLNAGVGDIFHAAEAEDEEAVPAEPFNVNDVDPETMERARRAVVAMLSSNSGECPKAYVRTLLKQVGIAGCPIAALGAEIFFAGAEVFLRRASAQLPAPSLPPAGKQQMSDELRQQMLSLVQDAEGRYKLTEMADKLQWHGGSMNHTMYGPLKRAIGQVPELFFEPNKVFLASVARQYIVALGEEDIDGQPVAQEEPALTVASAPYVADPFSELLQTILAWLQQGAGVLEADAVAALIKELGFKPRAVIAALSHEVFWSHSESECEVLLRTAGGAAQHPKPLPDVYLHHVVHHDVIVKVREMGAKAKLDKLAGAMGWNRKSELMRTYGTLRVVIQGMRELFYDPHRLYLKRALEGVVEWPVTREGRQGPKAVEENAALMHWTPAADDPKAAGDPEGLNFKRQILGTVMGHGGRCDVAVLRQLLQGLDGGEGTLHLETFFEATSPRNLRSVLFWSNRTVCRRQTKAAEAVRPEMDDQVSAEVRQVLIDTVNSKGTVPLSELQAALEEAKLSVKVDEAMLFSTAQRIPEFFFFPEIVFMRHLVEPLIREVPLHMDTADLSAPQLEEESTQPKILPTEAELQEDAAMLALAEAAASLPDDAVPGAPALEYKPPVKADDGFFTYGEFEKQPEVIERAPVKKRRIGSETAVGGGAPGGALWGGDDVPPWASEGCAVTLRQEGHAIAEQVGVITRLNGTVATVQLMLGDRAALMGGGGLAGAALAKELDFPISRLLPIAPQVGASVKVVAGKSCGLQGTMIGLAGDKGVIQIGKIQYETLPMSHLAVTASWR